MEDVTTSVVSSPDVVEKLDTVIQGLHGIYDALWIIIGILAVTIVVKFLWTFLSKWLFGGI